MVDQLVPEGDDSFYILLMLTNDSFVWLIVFLEVC